MSGDTTQHQMVIERGEGLKKQAGYAMLEPTPTSGTKEHHPMRSEEIIIRLFCMVDDKLAHVNKRRNASLYPSEIVTISILFALKGVHYRAFYRSSCPRASWLSLSSLFSPSLISNIGSIEKMLLLALH